MKKRLLSICMLMSGLFSAYSQKQSTVVKETLSSVLPVSPEAGSLGKFSEIPVSKYTGIPDISIPIHTIKKGDISINLALSYHSGGNRVDEMASRVGLGWALNAGGSITRSARGIPDDFGFQNDIQKFINNQMLPQERLDYLYNVNNGTKDSEPDIYYLSLNDLSVKIFKGINGEWVTMPKNENIKIEEATGGYDWLITDGRGIRYKFRDQEITENTSYTRRGTGPASDGSYMSAISSWLLTEIEDTKENKVNFTYEGFTQNFLTVGGENVSVPIPSNEIRCVLSKQFTDVHNNIFGKRLKSITYSDGEVRFISSAQQRLDLPGDYGLQRVEIYNKREFIKAYKLFTSYFSSNGTGVNTPNIFAPMDNYRLRLDSVREESANAALKPYKFYYYSNWGLPSRNSHAQDHWGFFNGKDNQETSVSYVEFDVEKGADKSINAVYAQETLLNRIVYPTGGEVEYTYEANDFASDRVIDLGYQPVSGITGTNSEPGATIDGLTFHYEREFVLTSDQIDIGGTKFRTNSTVQGNGSGCSCFVDVYLQQPNGQVIPFHLGVQNEVFYLNQPGTYKLVGHITTEFPFPTTPLVYFNVGLEAKFPPKQGLSNITGPGLRVKKIKRTFSPGNVLNTYYTYKDPVTGLSSGKLDNLPNYARDITYENLQEIDPAHAVNEIYFCKCKIFSAASNYSLINTKGAYVVYTHVAVTEDQDGNAGKTTYKYNYEADPGSSTFFPFPPYTPKDWKRGQLLEEAYYKKTADGYELLKKQSYTYAVIPGSEYTAKGIKLGAGYVYTYPTGSNVTVSGLAASIYNVESDAYVLTSDTLLSKEGNRQLITVNNYTYSDSNYQLARTSGLRSDGKVRNRFVYYPSDYRANAGSSSLLTNMLRRNMVNIPVQEINTTGSGSTEKLSSALIYEYAYIPAPANGSEQFNLKNIYEADVKQVNLADRYNFVSLPANYIERISTPAINEYGQPLFRKVNGKQKIAYVWGYNGQYPVAEVKNADYQDVEVALGGAQAVRNFSNQLSPDEADLASFLSPLYTAATLKDAQVTTYSYKPGVGILSQTDPKRLTSYYVYDDYQRLKHIKDHNQDIVKNFDYHYAQPLPQLVSNTTTSRDYIKQGCPDGKTGSTVTYTVYAGKHRAATKAEVDALVEADFAANGQNYANINGTCSYQGNAGIIVTVGDHLSTGFTLSFVNKDTNKTYTFSFSSGGSTFQVPAGVYKIYFNENNQSGRYTLNFGGELYFVEDGNFVTIENKVLTGTTQVNVN